MTKLPPDAPVELDLGVVVKLSVQLHINRFYPDQSSDAHCMTAPSRMHCTSEKEQGADPVQRR